MKALFKSKTIWFNNLLILSGLTLAYAEQHFDLVQKTLPPDTAGVVLFFIGITGFALRLATNAPVIPTKQ